MTRRRARRLLRSIETLTEPFDEFDLVFIDGDHSYRATMENIALALRMLRPGGLVVVHDALTWPAVLPGAIDVAGRIPGVEVAGVTGADRRRLFVDEEPAWQRRVRRARDRLVGPPVDGLCVLTVDVAADIGEVRAAAALITRDVISTSQARRSGEWQRDRPAESELGKLVRRSREAITDPAAVLSRVRSRSGLGGPGRRNG
jgi:SAM-dependent methyltransferase